LDIICRFDGACDNGLFKRKDIYPPMGVGLAVFVDGEYQPELSKAIHFEPKPTNTSMVAEWEGCVAAFRFLSEIVDKESGDTYKIESDSQVVTMQWNGGYQIKEEHLKAYKFLAMSYAKKAGLEKLKIEWTPRKFNQEADDLSKIAIQDASLTYDSTPISEVSK
jgi:ribonuclease HI